MSYRYTGQDDQRFVSEYFGSPSNLRRNGGPREGFNNRSSGHNGYNGSIGHPGPNGPNGANGYNGHSAAYTSGPSTNTGHPSATGFSTGVPRDINHFAPDYYTGGGGRGANQPFPNSSASASHGSNPFANGHAGRSNISRPSATGFATGVPRDTTRLARHGYTGGGGQGANQFPNVSASAGRGWNPSFANRYASSATFRGLSPVAKPFVPSGNTNTPVSDPAGPAAAPSSSTSVPFTHTDGRTLWDRQLCLTGIIAYTQPENMPGRARVHLAYLPNSETRSPRLTAPQLVAELEREGYIAPGVIEAETRRVWARVQEAERLERIRRYRVQFERARGFSEEDDAEFFPNVN
ncbi:hypothetical protein GGR53DRAFT_467789 [Hypoxylon sp. FL1150]|nr:hypothetical protein GGR53DRAFT_467789 [Hypoxylon sp. FL1150]